VGDGTVTGAISQLSNDLIVLGEQVGTNLTISETLQTFSNSAINGKNHIIVSIGDNFYPIYKNMPTIVHTVPAGVSTAQYLDRTLDTRLNYDGTDLTYIAVYKGSNVSSGGVTLKVFS
jgi:hypothetical protein